MLFLIMKLGKNAEIDNFIDNLFRLAINNNVNMGVQLFIGKCDQTQLKQINGRPLLTSPNIIKCFKIVPISNSIRT